MNGDANVLLVVVVVVGGVKVDVVMLLCGLLSVGRNCFQHIVFGAQL